MWDNDAVQLCAQAMLLEEAFGRSVSRGYQFHVGSRERVLAAFVRGEVPNYTGFTVR